MRLTNELQEKMHSVLDRCVIDKSCTKHFNLIKKLNLTASKIKVRDGHEFHELARINEKNH